MSNLITIEKLEDIIKQKKVAIIISFEFQKRNYNISPYRYSFFKNTINKFYNIYEVKTIDPVSLEYIYFIVIRKGSLGREKESIMFFQKKEKASKYFDAIRSKLILEEAYYTKELNIFPIKKYN